MKKLPIYLVLLFLVFKGCEAQKDLKYIEAKDYEGEILRHSITDY
jgi:hypothetical protein